MLIFCLGKRDDFTEIKLLVFDCFGVICSEVAPPWLNSHFDNETATEIKNGLIYKVDMGEVSEDEMALELSKLCSDSPEKIKKDWLEIAKKQKNVIDFILECKKTYKTALLSNASSGFIHRVFSDEELEKLFDYTLISAEERMAKPDEKFFRLVLERSGIKAENAIMIDDNRPNLDSAENVGMNTFLFRGDKPLERLKKIIL